MTEPLDLKGNYTGGDYVYRMGGDGFATNAAGKKLVDCSHMVNLLLTGAGYNIPYEDTRVMENSSYYTTVLPQDVKKGDIALWINATPNRDIDSYDKRWDPFKRIYKVEKIFEDI